LPDLHNAYSKKHLEQSFINVFAVLFIDVHPLRFNLHFAIHVLYKNSQFTLLCFLGNGQGCWVVGFPLGDFGKLLGSILGILSEPSPKEVGSKKLPKH
jgi:hypothetical protein